MELYDGNQLRPLSVVSAPDQTTSVPFRPLSNTRHTKSQFSILKCQSNFRDRTSAHSANVGKSQFSIPKLPEQRPKASAAPRCQLCAFRFRLVLTSVRSRPKGGRSRTSLVWPQALRRLYSFFDSGRYVTPMRSHQAERSHTQVTRLVDRDASTNGHEPDADFMTLDVDNGRRNGRGGADGQRSGGERDRSPDKAPARTQAPSY